MTDQEEKLTDSEFEDQLPVPVGYRLLIALPKVEETYDSGILKSAKTIHEETVLSMVGAVIAMGEQAYKDDSRFPTGPWCKVGDYVVFRSSAGTRLKVGGQEFRLMNDDSIEAVVKDPRSLSRAY